jgi:SAM-dependent methyltransferase
MRILNIGAGNKLVEGAVNHDRTAHRPEITVVHDLNDLPWPWEDNSFDLIVACAVLEHLKITLLESVGECWRILASGGQLHIKIPYWNHPNTYADPTHHWRFDLQTLTLFDPDTKYGRDYSFYTDRKWRIIKEPHLNPQKSSIIGLLEVRK